MLTEGACNRSFAMRLTTDEKNNEPIPHCRRLRCERNIMRPLHIIPNRAAVVGNTGNLQSYSMLELLARKLSCMTCTSTSVAREELLRSKGIRWTHQLVIHEPSECLNKHPFNGLAAVEENRGEGTYATLCGPPSTFKNRRFPRCAFGPDS